MGSSSSSQTSNLDSTTNAVDNRVIDGTGSVVGGNITVSQNGSGAVTIKPTDWGALDLANKIDKRAQTSVGNSVQAVQTVAGDAGATITKALADVTKLAQTQQPNQTQNKTVQLLIIAGAVVAAIIVSRSGK